MRQDNSTPEWLQKLQESSWELELLLSGGAIFTLLQAASFFAEAVQSLNVTTSLPNTGLFLLIGMLGIQVLTLGFGLHLLLRALWVALVCVTYLYPQGARPERVRWRRPFRSAPPSSEYFYGLLTKLNRTCATVMFLAIISTMLLGGLLIVFIVLAWLPAIYIGHAEPFQYLWYFRGLLLVVVLYLLDMTLFGALRRVPGLVWLLFPAFWLLDRLTLRIVFQPALWLFASHVSRGRMIGLLTMFMGFTLILSYTLIYQDLHLPKIFDRRTHRFKMAPGPELLQENYLDEMAGQPVRGTAIASKYVDKPFLEVFIVYRKEFEQDVEKRDSVQYLSDIVGLAIDDSLYQRVDWYPTRKKATDQWGITALVPIGHLALGPHQLLIGSRVDSSRQQLIPFWKVE